MLLLQLLFAFIRSTSAFHFFCICNRCCVFLPLSPVQFVYLLLLVVSPNLHQCFYQASTSAMSMDKISNAVPLSNPLSRTVLEIRSGFSKTLLWSCAEPTVVTMPSPTLAIIVSSQHHLLIYLDLPLPSYFCHYFDFNAIYGNRRYPRRFNDFRVTLILI